jgi:hypothetical protein
VQLSWSDEQDDEREFSVPSSLLGMTRKPSQLPFFLPCGGCCWPSLSLFFLVRCLLSSPAHREGESDNNTIGIVSCVRACALHIDMHGHGEQVCALESYVHSTL